jgi:hypothetical protein
MDRLVGSCPFTDGAERAVYKDAGGWQYVIGYDGERYTDNGCHRRMSRRWSRTRRGDPPVDPETRRLLEEADAEFLARYDAYLDQWEKEMRRALDDQPKGEG